MPSEPHTPGRQAAKTELFLDAAQRAAAYIGSSHERGVFPTEEALRGLDRFPTELNDAGIGADKVVAMLDEFGSPATVTSTGGRYFGFVNGGTDPAASAASVLLGAWDQNTALPVMSPVGARLDEIAARWSLELLGLPDTAIAAFCPGASVANLTCLIAARDALLLRSGWNVDERGLAGAPPLKVVASEEIHASVAKALRAAGIGTDQVVSAPTDECGRVRADLFPTVDETTIVLLQAGNVNTGHSDPFLKLIPGLRRRGAWVHIDGAFGLWAGASETQRRHTDGAELADSWATDAHKWLNASYDCGIAICRNPDDLRRAMAFSAAYMDSDAERAGAHLGLQMSQRARGAEIWAILAGLGRKGVADLVHRLCRRAEQMASLLDEAGVTVLVPPALNQVLVRFDDDETTEAVIAAVQKDRTCWAGGTVWQGRRAMRISVSDASTTPEDIAVSAEAMVRCWNRVAAGPGTTSE
ncbi:pyridoxal phosphate-dependent decarboxylase family protein [Salininema proteolyticum]|uniref:Pyridoxal phosphate-dependent decarboxylase family protein n=1 Tax=Salininema proteolyticum TaxID=1607685 RepID=A0ABV8U3I5_9ACTN